MRFCDCGCADCRKQVGPHEPCRFMCEAELVEQVTRHGREIIVVNRDD